MHLGTYLIIANCMIIVFQVCYLFCFFCEAVLEFWHVCGTVPLCMPAGFHRQAMWSTYVNMFSKFKVLLFDQLYVHSNMRTTVPQRWPMRVTQRLPLSARHRGAQLPQKEVPTLLLSIYKRHLIVFWTLAPTFLRTNEASRSPSGARRPALNFTHLMISIWIAFSLKQNSFHFFVRLLESVKKYNYKHTVQCNVYLL